MEKEELVVAMLPNMKLTEERKVCILGLTYAWKNLFKVIDGPNCPFGSVALHPLTFAAQRFGHSSVGRVHVVLGSFGPVGVARLQIYRRA